jgi:hypothetical protein
MVNTMIWNERCGIVAVRWVAYLAKGLRLLEKRYTGYNTIFGRTIPVLVGGVLCPMIICHMWSILVGYLTKAEDWLILKAVSKDIANNSLQCGLASKQVHKATTQNSHTQNWYTLKSNRKCIYCGSINQHVK